MQSGFLFSCSLYCQFDLGRSMFSVGVYFYDCVMAKHLVISTSGNPDSNSRRMGRIAFAHLQERKIDCDWIDIREMDLPLCDADKCYGMPGSRTCTPPSKAPMDNHRRAGL